jgi:hypothetical protein
MEQGVGRYCRCFLLFLLFLTLQQRVGGVRVAENLFHLLAHGHVQEHARVVAVHEALGPLEDSVGGPGVGQLVLGGFGGGGAGSGGGGGGRVPLQHALDTLHGAATTLARRQAHAGGGQQDGEEAHGKKEVHV